MSHLEAEIGALERESRQLTDLFHCIVNDMKGSTAIWEDFSTKAAKLHVALRSTIVVITPFLDAFQKVADLANGSRGATRDIGVALTRLCVRHRSIDTKLRAFAAAITDTVVEPLQMRLEEWKKTNAQMDRDHSKGCITHAHAAKYNWIDESTFQLQLIDLQSNEDLKVKLQVEQVDLEAFWITLALTLLTARFDILYVCESSFLVMNIIKNKQRMRLEDKRLEHCSRIAATSFTPDFKKTGTLQEMQLFALK